MPISAHKRTKQNRPKKELKSSSENKIIDFKEYLPKDSPILQIELEEVEPENKTKYRKDGKPKKTHSNSQKEVKKEVFAYKSIDEIRDIINFFLEKKWYIHYLVFVIQFNTARRNGDVLNLKWKNFYFPDGRFREDILEIVEDKTDKFASPFINIAVKKAINLYIEKMGIDPSENNYETPVFLQISGTHKGKVLSYGGHLKALKKAVESVGIDRRIGTHSARKSYGFWSRKLHPNDSNSMQILKMTYNHENESDTSRYIGLSKEEMDKYMNDMGDFFDNCIMGNEQYIPKSGCPVTSLDTNDLRDIITLAYTEGKNNADCTDAETHLEAMNTVMEMIDDLAI